MGSRELLSPQPTPASHTREHRVQFYESDDFLALAVADFLAPGISDGHPLVVIATESHRCTVTSQLKSKGLDVDRASEMGYLTLLDARHTLDAFMVGSSPDAARFRNVLGAVLQAAHDRGGPGAVLRLYGEMVDLLWRDGNTEGALQLEQLWNDLARTYEFSLLCAYAMGNFYRSADSEGFQQICRHHTHVAPSERLTAADSDSRLVAISILEQRARALEAEVEHRKELERRLREALDARRLTEDALRSRERELSSLLDERQRLLESERLARLEAENATRAKSQFLAVMSHELRTPLNAIAGHVQLLDMGIHGTVTGPQREALGRIAKSQRHLLRLINEVLNLSRVETGRVEYAVEDMAIQDVVAELLPMVEPQLGAKHLGWDVDRTAPPLYVRADREKLVQVLLNLLSNAIKFTPAGGRIMIDFTTRDDEPELAYIRVSDTGIGIPPEKQEMVFEPFVQVHTGPTRVVEGAGLGLAISRELARGMGGELRVRSREGGGCIFTLTLLRSNSAA
ncbi:MAG: ATP-binding protein [Gemmatimonadota bacterium]|nr:ATP-binding protein [Gemmatimonadota bacterium]